MAFDVADLLGITDITMIAGASNERQVMAMAEEIEKDLFLVLRPSAALARA